MCTEYGAEYALNNRCFQVNCAPAEPSQQCIILGAVIPCVCDKLEITLTDSAAEYTCCHDVTGAQLS